MSFLQNTTNIHILSEIAVLTCLTLYFMKTNKDLRNQLDLVHNRLSLLESAVLQNKMSIQQYQIPPRQPQQRTRVEEVVIESNIDEDAELDREIEEELSRIQN